MVLKTSRHKTSELLLVLLTEICLAGNGLCAAQSSTATGTKKPPPHAAAKQAGTHTPATQSTTNRAVTSHPGTGHYVSRNATSRSATASTGKRTPYHSTAYASRRQGSSARYRHSRPSSPRALSGQQRLARLHLQPERVQEIQQALIREGYMQGEATGQWDSRTHDAMLRYQTMHGFPPTGLPEAKSLMKLGLGSHPLPPELDHGEAGVANPSPAPGDLTVTPASPPVSQAVPPA